VPEPEVQEPILEHPQGPAERPEEESMKPHPCVGGGKEVFTNARYCSKECKAKHYPYKVVKCTCLNCGKEFTISLCDYNRGGGKYCNTECALCGRAGRLRKQTTRPERMIELQLKSHNLKYMVEYPFPKDNTIADFWLPDHRIAIFCDGDYWHDPHKHDLDDYFKTEMIRTWGHEVFRFSENNIMNDSAKCIDQVQDYITSRKNKNY
jgi:very-short-patch-repair endonuclease